MSTPSEVPTLISEADDRYDLIGLDVVNRATDEVESFIAFTRDEVDMPGYVESREKGYADTDWYTVRIWRTRVRAGDMRAVLSTFEEYVKVLSKIHVVYAQIVMDTEKDRTLHARHVENADNMLTLVKSRLSQVTSTTDKN